MSEDTKLISTNFGTLPINPTKEWLKIIKNELEKCHIIVPFITQNFRPSEWTDQESGIAMAHGAKVLSLYKTGFAPHGFLQDFQGIPITDKITDELVVKMLKAILQYDDIAKIIRIDIVDKYCRDTFDNTEDIDQMIKRLHDVGGYNISQLNKILNFVCEHEDLYDSFDIANYIDELISKDKEKLDLGLVQKWEIIAAKPFYENRKKNNVHLEKTGGHMLISKQELYPRVQ